MRTLKHALLQAGLINKQDFGLCDYCIELQPINDIYLDSNTGKQYCLKCTYVLMYKEIKG